MKEKKNKDIQSITKIRLQHHKYHHRNLDQMNPLTQKNIKNDD
jgi:hypothetical protein